MASTNHTTNLNLNQWLATDPVIREDFNADNQKIEAAVNALSTGKAEVTFGTYTGDGSSSRTITTSFTPTAVLLTTDRGRMYDSGNYGGLFTADMPTYGTGSNVSAQVVEGGFRIGYSSTNKIYTNCSGTSYYYLLFR